MSSRHTRPCSPRATKIILRSGSDTVAWPMASADRTLPVLASPEQTPVGSLYLHAGCVPPRDRRSTTDDQRANRQTSSLIREARKIGSKSEVDAQSGWASWHG